MVKELFCSIALAASIGVSNITPLQGIQYSYPLSFGYVENGDLSTNNYYFHSSFIYDTQDFSYNFYHQNVVTLNNLARENIKYVPLFYADYPNYTFQDSYFLWAFAYNVESSPTEITKVVDLFDSFNILIPSKAPYYNGYYIVNGFTAYLTITLQLGQGSEDCIAYSNCFNTFNPIFRYADSEDYIYQLMPSIDFADSLYGGYTSISSMSISEYESVCFDFVITYDITQDATYTNGYNQGLEDGYNQGYNTGFDNGVNSSSHAVKLFTLIADVPIYYLKSLFNFSFFGIPMYTLVLGVITLLVLLFVIKKVV